MFHFKPSLFAKIASPAAHVASIAPGFGRADHARMLAHAAKRRLAAQGQDAGYWKACAPAAIAKAAAIRAEAGFARLP
jgi:hypothetical protein